ncbi:MAG: DUF4359 domain-containing protein [Cyanobacteria bacterium P01_H01_bin.58]
MSTVLVVTNPSPAAYETYALEQTEKYLNEEVCTDLPEGVSQLLGGQCVEIIQTLQPQIMPLIRDRTKRLNIGIASIYRTSLGIPGLEILPRYEIETVGILKRFLTYRAQKV